MLDTAIGLGQLLALAMLFLGLVLLSQSIREAMVRIYVGASIDRIGGRSTIHVLELTEEMCRALYIGRNGRPSPAKTFAVGSIAGLFVGVPVAFVLMFTVMGSSGSGLSSEEVMMQRVLVWHLLPLTVLIHWASEYLLATVLWNALRYRPRHSLAAVFGRLAIALLVTCTAPILLSRLAFNYQNVIPQGLTFAWGFMLNGPGVLLGYLTFKISPNGSIFWLAVAACMTFASSILLLALSTLLVRTRLGYLVLAGVVQRMGRASGPTLIAIAVGLFGLLADVSSSKSLLASILGLELSSVR